MTTTTKTVLITGASSGIGEALFKLYNDKGYQVIGCGRNKSKLAVLAAIYPNSRTLAFDINDQRVVERETKDIEPIDLLILNAGDCRYIEDARHFDGLLFSQIIATNLQSMGGLLQHLLPRVSVNGQVVFVSSSATILPFPKAQAYGASKAGIDYLANSLRLDLKREHIDVTLVHPGFVKTRLTAKNTFDMPFLISSEQAAERIYQGVKARKDYLHFPKRLTLLMKTLALLPNCVWHQLAMGSQQS
jgi:NADP-dependent 3-hydroxy acid dehydrogenase YdfG